MSDVHFEAGDRVTIVPMDDPDGPTTEVTVDRIVGRFVGVTRDGYVPDPRASATEMVIRRDQIVGVVKVEEIENPTEQADITETPVAQITNLRNF